MRSRLPSYRSTLIAAAVAVGCLGLNGARAHERDDATRTGEAGPVRDGGMTARSAPWWAARRQTGFRGNRLG